MKQLILLVALATILRMDIASADSIHLKFGNPSDATADVDHEDNYLIEKPFFALSYNNEKGTPNWVSWRLIEDDLGNAPRLPFYPDQTLPDGFKRVTPADYAGGGFDRGHMCPHSDRGSNVVMSKATFVMSNMIPQSPNVNEKAWAQFESYCRDLVENHNKILYIVCGPYGEGGEGRSGKKDTLGTTQTVTVPSKCWKVVLVLDAGPRDPFKRINSHTRLIGVVMPNDMSVGEDWSRYRVSVGDIEDLTDYTFFNAAHSTIIESLKENVDKTAIVPLHSLEH